MSAPPITTPGSRSSATSRPPATSPRRSRSWPRGSSGATGSRPCSASPGRASRPPSPGPSSRCSGPTLVIAPNKSLAAQLANEFREFFPKNRVEYFVSYYDYYQPEAYIASSDTYIEKDSSVNDEIDRLRHCRHVGPPDPTRRDRGGLGVVHLRPRLTRGVRQEDPVPAGGRDGRPAHDAPPARRHAATSATTSTSCGASSGSGATPSRCTRRTRSTPCASRCSATRSSASPAPIRSPASCSATSPRSRCSRRRTTSPARSGSAKAVERIEHELQQQLARFEKEGKLLEAQRLRMRIQYDLEMMQEVGYCNGIENYSAPIDGRCPGPAAPHPPRLLPEGLPARHRRVARDGAAAARPVRGRPVPQGDAHRSRVPAPVGRRQPAAALRRVLRAHQPVRLPVGHAVRLRDRAVLPGRRADRAAHRSDRPRDHREADEGPDRRPHGGRSPSG